MTLDYKTISRIAVTLVKQITALTPNTIDDVVAAAIEAALQKLEPLFGGVDEIPALPADVEAIVDSVVAEFQASGS